MEYSYEEVFEAYIKLKTYIYYDSTNLYMRKQLAVFETDLSDDIDETHLLSRLFEYKNFEDIYNVDFETNDGLNLYERKLKIFTKALNSHHENPEFFKTFLKRIKAKFLPKKIEDKKPSKIITNVRTAEKYTLTRSSVFIDAPIEIHLLSVIWILKSGVDLDKNLSNSCFGNRLILNKEKNKVVQGSGLFKPYPKQYQTWRDNAVNTARDHLKKDENILILNLDIRDFFYSVRIPKTEIEKSPYPSNSKRYKPLNNLYVLFGEIHEVFTDMLARKYKSPYDFSNEIFDLELEISHYILPIGLLSSFILANHYLVSFDNRIIKNAKPVYYGRYVDDILMVIPNPIVPSDRKVDSIRELNFDFNLYRETLNKSDTHDSFEKLSEKDYDSLSDLEQFVLSNFNPIITLIDKPSFLLAPNEEITKKDRVFKLNGYNRLYCQSDKTLLYYFDKDESTLVIDKLKRDLEEKSSEFRNYTDAEGQEDFEESAYHLLYDGTEGKIRTLKDYKEDKFGLSVYLSKKIFNALRRADKISTAEAEKLVRFFQGCNALNLSSLWERVFVFLIVNHKAAAYVEFYLNCCEAIKRIELPPGIKTINRDDYQSHVLEFLDCANELSLSLHPRFLSDIRKVKRTYHFSFNALKSELELYQKKYSPTDENSYYMTRFRQSNLIRHHYVAQPLLTYTENIKNDFQNFTDLKIPF